MATTPVWVSLVVAFLGLAGIVLTQYLANRREDIRWQREGQREQTRWTHEDAARSHERAQQRLADSYLEVLRLVEREGQWIEASITNWKIAAEEDPDDRVNGHGLPRVKVPEPAITDRATIAAHLAAFGSARVHELYQAWRFTVTAINTEDDMLDAYAAENYPEGPSLDDLKRLDELGVQERAERQGLADAIAKELGHR